MKNIENSYLQIRLISVRSGVSALCVARELVLDPQHPQQLRIWCLWNLMNAYFEIIQTRNTDGRQIEDNLSGRSAPHTGVVLLFLDYTWLVSEVFSRF